MKVGRRDHDGREQPRRRRAEPASRRAGDGKAPGRRSADKARSKVPARRPSEPRGQRTAPQTAPTPRPAERPARPKSTSQAKARAKARKAKAPKVVRPPLRERLIARLAGIDLRPQRLAAKVPFVVLVIGALGVGLGVTLWLSTDAAQRSYQLGNARATNDALSQQKEALERDVRQAESAPALAEAARNLGMIPSRDTAHLVQDPSGNWVVVGKPKPAEGVPPPPLNAKLPDEKPPAPPAAPRPAPGNSVEVPVRVTAPGAPAVPGLEVPVRTPSATDHAPAGPALPGPAPLPDAALPPVVPVVPDVGLPQLPPAVPAAGTAQ